MARTITGAQMQRLTLTLGVLSDLALSETRPTAKAALHYCTSGLLEIVAQPKAPPAAADPAAPPAATVKTTPPASPKPARTAAQRSASASKANKTRAANKAAASTTATTTEASDQQHPVNDPNAPTG
jgi:hypothetical protein